MVPNKPNMTTIICRKFPRIGAHWKPRKSKICLSNAESSCSAQRQMSEQRPVQQPMVPAASERRARREIRVLRRRCLPTPEQPPPGACPARPGPSSPAPRPPPAARRSRGPGSRSAFVSFPGGQRSERRARPERLAGVPASHCAAYKMGTMSIPTEKMWKWEQQVPWLLNR